MEMDLCSRVGKWTVIWFTIVGVVQCLDCLTCDWNIQNDTMEDDCLGAPYTTTSISCPGATSVAQRYMCQTHAKFDVKSGVMSLQMLERKCGLKHSMCNNACGESTTDCWMCCNDNSNCNGFPLHSNIVVITSSAHRQQHCYNSVLSTITFALSLVVTGMM